MLLLWTTPLADTTNARSVGNIPEWFVPVVPSLGSLSQKLQGVSRVAGKPCVQNEDGAGLNIYCTGQPTQLPSAGFSLKLKHIVSVARQMRKLGLRQAKWQPEDLQRPGGGALQPLWAFCFCICEVTGLRGMILGDPLSLSPAAWMYVCLMPLSCFPAKASSLTPGCFFGWTEVIWFPKSINKLKEK